VCFVVQALHCETREIRGEICHKTTIKLIKSVKLKNAEQKIMANFSFMDFFSLMVVLWQGVKLGAVDFQ
jgi:hypothetical protein